jgi:hypothetical protein
MSPLHTSIAGVSRVSPVSFLKAKPSTCNPQGCKQTGPGRQDQLKKGISREDSEHVRNRHVNEVIYHGYNCADFGYNKKQAELEPTCAHIHQPQRCTPQPTILCLLHATYRNLFV